MSNHSNPKFNVGQFVRVVEVITKNFEKYLGAVGRIRVRNLVPPQNPAESGYYEYGIVFRDPPLPVMFFGEWELERYVEPFRESDAVQV